MLVELVGGPYDGLMVTTTGAAPDPELTMPVGAELQLRPGDIRAHLDPDLPVVRYRFTTEPRHDVGARFVYRYVR